MGDSFAPPPPLRLSTAGRMLGETELLNALQRGARQAFAFLDGKWGSIPPLWWYRFTDIDWRGQRVTFMVDGRAIEATETVIDRPPLEREERRDFVEKLDEKREHERLTKAVKAALGSATDIPSGLEKKQLFLAWGEEEKKKWPQAYYCELKVTDVWIVIFTGVLAFVTFLLVRATVRLWNATVENERPWVGPITANCDQIIVGQPSRGTIVIKNTGRSPALRMRVAHRGIFSTKDKPPRPPLTCGKFPRPSFPMP